MKLINKKWNQIKLFIHILVSNYEYYSQDITIYYNDKRSKLSKIISSDTRKLFPFNLIIKIT